MTQEEFDKAVADYPTLLWDSGVVISDTALSGVITLTSDRPIKFDNCTIDTLDLSGLKEVTRVRLNRCVVKHIIGKSVSSSLAIFGSTVDSIHLQDFTYLDFLIRKSTVLSDCRIKRSTANIEVRSSTLARLRVEDCKSGSLVMDGVANNVGFQVTLTGNAFNHIKLRNVPSAGRITTPEWNVDYTSDWMQIGCQGFSIKAWREFTDDHINFMDDAALGWWKKWKDIIFAIVDSTASNYPEVADQIDDLEWVENKFRENAEYLANFRRSQ